MRPAIFLLYCWVFLQCKCFAWKLILPLRSTWQLSAHASSVATKSARHFKSSQEIKEMPSKSFFIETHGCQMNLADSDVVRSVLLSMNYTMSEELETADLVLVNTCAIRENAEAKVWQRLKYFESLRKKNRKTGSKPKGFPKIGVLGCMAERLKDKLFDDFKVDFIAGPDSYRQLPNLIEPSLNQTSFAGDASDIRGQANTQLSYDETYADIAPARLDEGMVHAFVTIMRGCDNHCAFCIVPYTRGRERSRPVASVLDEVRALAHGGEVKEIVLLGQNVNSYYDAESPSVVDWEAGYRPAEGFAERSRRKQASLVLPVEDRTGVRFAELLHRVAEVDPEMRIRFQSPHPKDFSDDVLQLIAHTPNICNSLHMPAQHGSSAVLQRMQRGYSREAYIQLVSRARELICGASGAQDKRSAALGLSSDFIVGFCGETDDEHADLLSLVREVGFDQAFTYKYSRREQTFAGLHLADDVPEALKLRRLQQLVEAFQTSAAIRNSLIEVDRLHVVLVEGPASSSHALPEAAATWTGRTDTNKRVVFADRGVLSGLTLEEARQFSLLCVPRGSVEAVLSQRRARSKRVVLSAEAHGKDASAQLVSVQKGDYVVVQVTRVRGHTLTAVPIAKTSLQEAARLSLTTLQ